MTFDDHHASFGECTRGYQDVRLCADTDAQWRLPRVARFANIECKALRGAGLLELARRIENLRPLRVPRNE